MKKEKKFDTFEDEEIADELDTIEIKPEKKKNEESVKIF